MRAHVRTCVRMYVCVCQKKEKNGSNIKSVEKIHKRVHVCWQRFRAMPCISRVGDDRNCRVHNTKLIQLSTRQLFDENKMQVNRSSDPTANPPPNHIVRKRSNQTTNPTPNHCAQKRSDRATNRSNIRPSDQPVVPIPNGRRPTRPKALYSPVVSVVSAICVLACIEIGW